MRDAAGEHGRAAGHDRRWWIAAGLVGALATVVRVHNVFAFPALLDFDGPGHALNVFAWFEGRPPDPRSWSGFHPPLYYALGAGLWHVLPASLPVHVTLRLLSAAAAAGSLLLVWRTLGRATSAADAAIVAVLLWCVPAVALVSGMTGNETLGALFVTAALVRTLAPLREGSPPARHALVTGLLLGGAVLAKSTGLLAAGACALAYAHRLHGRPRSLAVCVALVGLTPLVLAAPHYGRLMGATGGSPFAAVSAAAASPEVRAAMAEQPPGERRLRDYVALPAATLLAPVYLAPGLERAVPGLLYASTWADAHVQYLPAVPHVLRAEAALAVAGLLPTALLLLGFGQVLRRPREHADWLGPLALAAALVPAFLAYTWKYPTYSAVKASYLLPALLPGAYALCLGLRSFRGAARAGLRAALLGIAVAATGLTAYGWWR